MPLSLEEQIQHLERRADQLQQRLEQVEGNLEKLLQINEAQSKTLKEILDAWNGATFTVSLLKMLGGLVVFCLGVWGATKIGK